MGLIPGSGRSPRGRHGIPLQYSCLEKQRSLEAYSPWGCKDSDRTEATQHAHCSQMSFGNSHNSSEMLVPSPRKSSWIGVKARCI